MNSAEIKLQIFRLVDSQEENTLRDIYNMIVEKVNFSPSDINLSILEEGYKAMSEDKEREAEALEWIEGTHNFEEI